MDSLSGTLLFQIITKSFHKYIYQHSELKNDLIEGFLTFPIFNSDLPILQVYVAESAATQKLE